ncbi:MAG: hydrolase [Chloroflexi bacterium]|nr:hydrolase [Chloroflexota bacterium]MCI0831493.1 hydrolase [Chloroflexota bacterium]MCI0882941.1 hydrolase [Chloroflexota bacterium]
MHAFICRTCGVQYPPSEEPPASCLICEDERQYVGRGGQQWTTLEQLRAGDVSNQVVPTDPGVTSIFTVPRFAIGQRAILVQTEGGNLLWDCVSYIDDETIEAINSLGGVQGISVSHPHFYAAVGAWSEAFGAPVHLPSADREYFVRTDIDVTWYEGTHELWPGLTLVQTGGHFEGSAVLHWAGGAEGRGALFTGDSISTAADTRWVTFMRSYPNFIPLPPASVKGIVASLDGYEFDRIYGGWFGNDVREDARAVVERSAERYVRWSGG